eukprot:jgi/Ulvmu1/8698/UM047_0038.1
MICRDSTRGGALIGSCAPWLHDRHDEFWCLRCKIVYNEFCATVRAYSAMSGRLVPWASWNEWERVRAMLFAEDATAVQAGLSAVMGWRRRGKLPLGIDVTAMLLATSLNDPHGPGPCISSKQPTASGMQASLQNEYSLTIIRLVNGVSDSCQKGKVAGSVSKNADNAGLHPMLVDVRHEATHNHIPSLHMLRLAASHALSWLYLNYWSAQNDRYCAAVSDAVTVLQRLMANQSARGAAAAAPGQSPPLSDSDLDESEKCDVSASPAALKKQQKSLLGELKPIFPSSHPADLAHVLLHAPATLAAPSAASPGLEGSKREVAVSARRNCAVSMLTLLSDVYAGLISHVIVQSFSILKTAKTAAILHGTDGHASSEGAEPAPRLVQSSAFWAAAALTASAASHDPPAHQQHLSHALHQLFQPTVVFPASHVPCEPQAKDPSACQIDSLVSLFSTAAADPARSASAASPSRAKGTEADQRRSTAGQAASSEGDANGDESHEQAVTAMLATEQMLLQLCQDGGEATTRSQARLVAHLVSAVRGSDDDAAAEDLQPQRSTDAALAGRRAVHSTRGDAAVADAASASVRAEPAAPADGDAHATILQRLAGKQKRADAGTASQAGAVSAPAAAKRMRAAPTTADAPSAVATGAAPRFQVAESWCCCPIGTLPSGVALVGVTLDFDRRPPAAVAAEAAAAEAADGNAAVGGPGAADHGGAVNTAGGAVAGVGGEGGTVLEDDGFSGIEATAAADVLAAYDAFGATVIAVEDGGGSDGVGMEADGGTGDGPAGGNRRGSSADAGPDAEAGVVTLRSMHGGALQGPAISDALRERVARALAVS